ncbi:MAG TPA: mucoidy inhibitor MuiA family protein [Hyphomicrobiaceae bacterium]|nr:mucoidy inhibitor MuiA family protein [Hyphomicrobiaceae bacterium]
MRSWIALALLPVAASTALAADIKGTSRVDAVTVFPSGAEIRRVGKVKLERGDHVVLFADLPARAIASSIRVEGKATGKLEIGSVDSRRVFVARTDTAVAATERKRIEDAIEKLKDERAVLAASAQAAEAQKTLISNLAQLPTRPAPANGAAAAQPDWGQIFGLIGQRFAEAQKTVLDTQVKIRDVDRQIKDLEGKLASLAPAQEERTEVKVFVNAGGPLDADITIRYQVGAASWVPFYDARLASGTKAQAPKLQLVRRASIQQRSGESWDEVALALSTTRPGAGTAAPELGTVTVDYEPDAPPRPAPMAARRAMVREDVVASQPAGEEESFARKAAPQMVDATEGRAQVESQAFQAIYAIAGRVTVPATGEAKRVQIDEATLDPALMVRTVPKREQKAYLYAKMAMARGTPILPGQVSLFRDATFVGNGRLPQLAPGEEHELGFGSDDNVRVRYTVAEEKRAETGIISASKTDTRSYRITVKNQHERGIAVTVLDQIPVSQNADIKVELLGKTAPTKQNVDDKRGVLAWEMTLAPDEEKAVEFGYRTTWPAAKKITYGN